MLFFIFKAIDILAKSLHITYMEMFINTLDDDFNVEVLFVVLLLIIHSFPLFKYCLACAHCFHPQRIPSEFWRRKCHLLKGGRDQKCLWLGGQLESLPSGEREEELAGVLRALRIRV